MATVGVKGLNVNSDGEELTSDGKSFHKHQASDKSVFIHRTSSLIMGKINFHPS